MMQHIILLHGALGSNQQLQPLADNLRGTFHVHSFNFSGHGGREFADEPFSIPFFSYQIEEYMQKQGIEQANIFGYSMGGYAALYLAKQQPSKINKIITLATKFYWDEKVAAKEVQLLNANTIKEKVPAFAAQLQQRHSPNNWEELLDKTKELLLGLGADNALQAEDYTDLSTACLLLLGDRDKMVTLDETIAVYKQLPSAQMGMLPGTAHAFEQVNVNLLSQLITGFIKP